MSHDKDKTLPESILAKRAAAVAPPASPAALPPEVVDGFARQGVTGVQAELLSMWSTVVQKFNAGEQRMDDHEGKLNELLVGVKALGAQVQRGVNRVALLTLIGVWVCAGCLVAFAAFKFWPSPALQSLGRASAQEHRQ